MAKTNAGWPKHFPEGDYDVDHVTRASGADAIVTLPYSGAERVEVLAIGIFARTGKIELVPRSAVAG